MASDLRRLIEKDLRRHPRVAYQGFFAESDAAERLIGQLPPLTPFRSDYRGAIGVVDWDHRLPSQALSLRIYAYYTAESYAAGQEAYDDRLEDIGRRDRYPEFDVPDFDNLAADEAYEIELSIAGEVGRCRLTSAWRREIVRDDARKAVQIASRSDEYQLLLREASDRPVHLGDLEAVSWTPPCESQHATWTLDVWYLLAFDGRLGTGRSFLVCLEKKQVVAVRDFSVRTA
jgi:hypothetical protein